MAEPQTWFAIMETFDGGHYVVRLDRDTLPEAVVVSGPHDTEGAAKEVRARMEAEHA